MVHIISGIILNNSFYQLAGKAFTKMKIYLSNKARGGPDRLFYRSSIYTTYFLKVYYILMYFLFTSLATNKH